MKGTTMLRPAGRVLRYLPKRSTTPARACGTIRTVLARSTTTKISSRASRIRITGGTSDSSSCFGLAVELGDRVDVRRGTADLEHLDRGSGLDGEVLVVRRGAPGLARELDLIDSQTGDPLGDGGTLAQELVGAEHEVGALVEARYQRGPDQRQHRDRSDRGDDELQREAAAERSGDRTATGPDGEHDQDEVEAHHLCDAEERGDTEPHRPCVLPQPVHDSSLSLPCSATGVPTAVLVVEHEGHAERRGQ